MRFWASLFVMWLVLAGFVMQGISVAKVPERPDMMVIILDAMRAESLSVYGNERSTTPFLEKLSKEAVIFDRAISPGNCTIITMPSIFTSVYPAVLGAHTTQVTAEKLHGVQGFGESWTTMAEKLRSLGYDTGLFTTNGLYTFRLEWHRGFNHVEVMQVDPVDKRPGYYTREADTQCLESAVAWFNQSSDPPRFAFVHLMGPHLPYECDDRFAGKFMNLEDLAPFKEKYDNTSSTSVWRLLIQRQLSMEGLRILQLSKNLYEACCLFCDDLLEKQLSRLTKKDEGKKRVVFITADHGEAFQEHPGVYVHRMTDPPYQENSRVPLIVVGQNVRAGRIQTPVSGIDLYPTVVELAGDVPDKKLQGKSLVDLIWHSGENLERSVLSETLDRETSNAKAVVTNQWRYLYIPGERMGWNIHYRYFTDWEALFDLSQDPYETRNLVAHHPEVAARLRSEIQNKSLSNRPGFHVRLNGDGTLRHWRADLVVDGSVERTNACYLSESSRFDSGLIDSTNYLPPVEATELSCYGQGNLEIASLPKMPTTEVVFGITLDAEAGPGKLYLEFQVNKNIPVRSIPCMEEGGSVLLYGFAFPHPARNSKVVLCWDGIVGKRKVKISKPFVIPFSEGRNTCLKEIEPSHYQADLLLCNGSVDLQVLPKDPGSRFEVTLYLDNQLVSPSMIWYEPIGKNPLENPVIMNLSELTFGYKEINEELDTRSPAPNVQIYGLYGQVESDEVSSEVNEEQLNLLKAMGYVR